MWEPWTSIQLSCWNEAKRSMLLSVLTMAHPGTCVPLDAGVLL